MLETKALTYKLNGDDSLGTFSGDASTYGNPDLVGDIMDPGCWDEYLGLKGTHYPTLWTHDMNEVIGSFDVIESTTSLKIRGSFNMDVQRGKEGYALLKRGDLNGLSVGFLIHECYFDDAGHRHISKAELMEVSLVAFPCNPEATAEAKSMIRGKKSLADLDDEERESFVSLVKEALDEIQGDDEKPEENETSEEEEKSDEDETDPDEDEEIKTLLKEMTESAAEVKSIIGGNTHE